MLLVTNVRIGFRETHPTPPVYAKTIPRLPLKGSVENARGLRRVVAEKTKGAKAFVLLCTSIQKGFGGQFVSSDK